MKEQFLRYYAAIAVFFLGIYTQSLSAIATGGDLGQTQLVLGSMRLINDITTILLIATPVIGIAFIVYFQIRKGAADENDQKRWHDRTLTAVVCIVIGISASSLIKVLVNSYMGGSV